MAGGGGMGGMLESAELSNVPTAKDTGDTLVNFRKYGESLTLPTDYKFYKITGLEWDNQGAVLGDILAGVDLVDAVSPVSPHTRLVALAKKTTQSGISIKQRVSDLWSLLIPAGAIIKPFASSSSTNNIGFVTVASVNNQKAITYTDNPALSETTAWTASTLQLYLRIYYKGYK